MKRFRRILDKLEVSEWLLQNTTRTDWKRLEIVELALDLLNKQLEEAIEKASSMKIKANLEDGRGKVEY